MPIGQRDGLWWERPPSCLKVWGWLVVVCGLQDLSVSPRSLGLIGFSKLSGPGWGRTWGFWPRASRLDNIGNKYIVYFFSSGSNNPVFNACSVSC